MSVETRSKRLRQATDRNSEKNLIRAAEVRSDEHIGRLNIVVEERSSFAHILRCHHHGGGISEPLVRSASPSSNSGAPASPGALSLFTDGSPNSSALTLPSLQRRSSGLRWVGVRDEAVDSLANSPKALRAASQPPKHSSLMSQSATDAPVCPPLNETTVITARPSTCPSSRDSGGAMSNDQQKIARLVKSGKVPAASEAKTQRIATMMSRYSAAESLLEEERTKTPTTVPLQSVAVVGRADRLPPLLHLHNNNSNTHPIVPRLDPTSSAAIGFEEDYWRTHLEIEESQDRHYFRTYLRKGVVPLPVETLRPSTTGAPVHRLVEELDRPMTVPVKQRAPHRHALAAARDLFEPALSNSHSVVADDDKTTDPPLAEFDFDDLVEEEEISRMTIEDREQRHRSGVLVGLWELRMLPSTEHAKREALMTIEADVYYRVLCDMSKFLRWVDQLELEEKQQKHRFWVQSQMLVVRHRNEQLELIRHHYESFEEIRRAEALVMGLLLRRYFLHCTVSIVRFERFSDAKQLVFGMALVDSESTHQRELTALCEKECRRSVESASCIIADSHALLYHDAIPATTAAFTDAQNSVLEWRRRCDTVMEELSSVVPDECHSRRLIDLDEERQRHELRRFHSEAADVDIRATDAVRRTSYLLETMFVNKREWWNESHRLVVNIAEQDRLVHTPEYAARKALKRLEVSQRNHITQFETYENDTKSLLRHYLQYSQMLHDSSVQLVNAIGALVHEEYNSRETILDMEDECYEDEFILTHQRMRRLDTVRSFIIASPSQERQARCAVEAEFRESLYRLMELDDHIRGITHSAELTLNHISLCFTVASHEVELSMKVRIPEEACRRDIEDDNREIIALHRRALTHLHTLPTQWEPLQFSQFAELAAQLIHQSQLLLDSLRKLSVEAEAERAKLQSEESFAWRSLLDLCSSEAVTHRKTETVHQFVINALQQKATQQQEFDSRLQFARSVSRHIVHLGRESHQEQESRTVCFDIERLIHCDETTARCNIAQSAFQSGFADFHRWLGNAHRTEKMHERSISQELLLSTQCAWPEHRTRSAVASNLLNCTKVLHVTEAHLLSLVRLADDHSNQLKKLSRAASKDTERFFFGCEEAESRKNLEEQYAEESATLHRLAQRFLQLLLERRAAIGHEHSEAVRRIHHDAILLEQDRVRVAMSQCVVDEDVERPVVQQMESHWREWLTQGHITILQSSKLVAQFCHLCPTLLQQWNVASADQRKERSKLAEAETSEREQLQEDMKRDTNWLYSTIAKRVSADRHLEEHALHLFRTSFDAAAHSLAQFVKVLDKGHPSELCSKVLYLLEDSDREEYCSLDFGWFDGFHHVSDDTVLLIQRVLEKNRNCTTLRMSNNPLCREPSFSRWTASSLSILGRLTSQLTTLDLRNCRLRDDDLVPSFTGFLAQDVCVLQRLHLDDNELSMKFCKEMFTVLRGDSTIVEVSTTGNSQISKSVGNVLTFYGQLNTIPNDLKTIILRIESDDEHTSQFWYQGPSRIDDEVVQLVCIALYNNSHVTSLNFAGNVGVSDQCCGSLASMLRGNPLVRTLDMSGTSMTDKGLAQITHVVESQPFRSPLLFPSLFSAPASLLCRRQSVRNLRSVAVPNNGAPTIENGFLLSIHHARISESGYADAVLRMASMERAWVEIEEQESWELCVATCQLLANFLEDLDEARREVIDQYDIYDVRQCDYFWTQKFFPAETRLRRALEAREGALRMGLFSTHTMLVECYGIAVDSLNALKVYGHATIAMGSARIAMASWTPNAQQRKELHDVVEFDETASRAGIADDLEMAVRESMYMYIKIVGKIDEMYDKHASFKRMLYERAIVRIKRSSTYSNASSSHNQEQEPQEAMLELDPKQYQALAHLPHQPWDLQGKGLAVAKNDPNVVAVDLSYAGHNNPEEPRCTPDTIAILYTLAKNNTHLKEVMCRGNNGCVTAKSAPLLSKLLVHLKVLDLSECNLSESEVLPYLVQGLTNPTCRLETLLLERNNFSANAVSTLCKALRVNNSVTTLSLQGNATMLPKVSMDFITFYTDVNKQSRQFRTVVRKLETNDQQFVVADLTFADGMRLHRPGGGNDDSQAGDHEVQSVEHYGVQLDTSPLNDAAVKLLCIALTRNTFVQELRLGGNSITDRGLKFLCHVLSSSVSIRVVDLSCNPFSDAGAEMLLHVVEKNKNIQELLISSNNGEVTQQTRRLILAQTQKNRTQANK